MAGQKHHIDLKAADEVEGGEGLQLLHSQVTNITAPAEVEGCEGGEGLKLLLPQVSNFTFAASPPPSQ